MLAMLMGILVVLGASVVFYLVGIFCENFVQPFKEWAELLGESWGHFDRMAAGFLFLAFLAVILFIAFGIGKGLGF